MLHYYVINEKSFLGQKQPLKEKLLKNIETFHAENQLKKPDDAFEVFYSTYAREAVVWLRQQVLKAPPGETVRVYAVGGDGILYDCLQAVEGMRHVELASMPFGNANDFLLSFGHQSFPALADVRSMALSPTVPTDVIKYNGSHFALSIIGIGVIGGSVILSLPVGKIIAKNKFLQYFKKVRYLISAIGAMFDKRVVERTYTVSIDGADYSGRYSSVSINNVTHTGGGMCISPFSLPNDGQLEITLIKYTNVIQTLAALPGYIKGKGYKMPHIVKTVRGQKIFVGVTDGDEPMLVGADGEGFQTMAVSAEILPGVLRVVSPNGVRYHDRFGRTKAESSMTPPKHTLTGHVHMDVE